MYLPHFNLEKSPFSLAPDPHFLFLTEQHREVLAGLLWAVSERKGFVALSGAPGTGKTTLLNKLLSCFPKERAQFAVIVNPAITRSELLETILMEFGEMDVPPSKPLRLAALKHLLFSAEGEGKTSVLVIDEAHLLTPELIEELYLLSNIETSEYKLVPIILSGQFGPKKHSVLSTLRFVRERIAICAHIDGLALSEVPCYIKTRWAQAGAQRELPFSEDAIELIAYGSGGIPRAINTICDTALLNAYSTGATSITDVDVEEVLHGLGISVSDQLLSPSETSPEASVARVSTELDPIPDPSASEAASRDSIPQKAKGLKLWEFANYFGKAEG